MNSALLENEVLLLNNKIEMKVIEREDSEDNDTYQPISPSSTPFQSLSNLQSFNEENLGAVESPKNEEYFNKSPPDLININTSTISLTFTSQMPNRFLTNLKNHFKVLFKVTYPDSFFEKVYKSDYFTILGLEQSSKEMICFAVIDIQNSIHKADILALGVVKEYQNKKIGSALLQKILEELTVMGINYVGLIVQQTNEHAIRLYRKFGFRVHKELANYYTFEDPRERKAYQMKKIIREQFWVFNVFKRIADKILLCERIKGKE